MALALAAWLLAALPAVPTARGQEAPAPRRPSLLLIVSDDQRHDTIDLPGDEPTLEVRTPSLDALAREGFVFERAYCMGSRSPAVCCPSRAMLLSGRRLQRFEAANPQPTAELPSLPSVLRDAGWRTFATGKWHNGPEWFQRGFDEGRAVFFGGMGSHTDLLVHDRSPEGRYPADARRPIGAFSSSAFADAAIDFLRARSDGLPFVCYVAFTAPHDPRTPPAEARAPYARDDLRLPPAWRPQHPFDNGEMLVRDERLAPWPREPAEIREQLADYYGMVAQLDAQVGRLLLALEQGGRAGDTLVVFTSDQGLAIGSHGLLGKQNLYEHSARAPLLLRGPGVPRGRSPALVYLSDLVPTVCELLGVEPPAEIDGRSLAPILRGEATGVRDVLGLAYKDVQRALTDGRWKLIRYPLVDVTQLFDLERDPHETRDLAADPEQAARVAALLERLRAWQREVGDEAPLSVEHPAPREFVPPGER